MSLKSVLVTGSNRGIGLEMIRQFVLGKTGLGNPNHVFACFRDSSKIDQLQEIADGSKKDGRTRVHLVKMEVANDSQIAEAVDYVDSIVGKDGLNLLINNAATLERDGSQLPRVQRDNLNKHFDVNVTSPMLVAQSFLPLLRRASAQHSNDDSLSVLRSCVINMTSGAGSIGSSRIDNLKLGVGYRVSKAALNMATKCLAIDLAEEYILFIGVSPGWVRTDMGTEKATSSTQESVVELFNSWPRFNREHNGGFFRRDGGAIPF